MQLHEQYIKLDYEPSEKYMKALKGKINNDLSLRLKLHDQGKKLLFIVPRGDYEDYKTNRLLSDKLGKILRNIIAYVADNNDLPKVKEILVINQQITHKKLSERKLRIAEAEADRRILRILEKYDPDTVLLFGPQLARKYLQHHSPTTDVDITRMSGWIFQEDFGGKKKYPTLGTLSLNHVERCETKKEQSENTPLIGFILRHVDTAFHGKNRYPIKENLKVQQIKSYSQFKKFFKKMIKQPVVALDTELEGFHRINNVLLCIQFAWKDTEGWFLPILHPETPFNQKELNKISKYLVDWLEGKYGEQEHVFQNSKFDIIQLRQAFKPRFYAHKNYDLQAGEWALQENRKFLVSLFGSAWSLDQFTLEHGSFLYYEEGELGKGDRANLKNITMKKIARYGVKDVCIPFQIRKYQLAEAKRLNHRKYHKLVRDQIGEMIHDFAEMEINGSPSDTDYLLKQLGPQSDFNIAINRVYKNLKKFKSVRKLEKKLIKENGLPEEGLFGNTAENELVFDINTFEHQKALFYDILEYEPISLRKDGFGSVDKAFQSAYAEFADPDKIKPVNEVAWFQRFKKILHNKNAFIKAIYKWILEDNDMQDGSVRPSFNYFGILTGRGGESDPSLHQIPSRDKEIAPLVKRQFISLPGGIQLKADYSVHEIRNWGNLSNDKNIMKAFKTGLKIWQEYRLLGKYNQQIRNAWQPKFDEADPHKQNVQLFMGIPAREVTKAQRTSIKEIAFGVIYDKSAPSLAETLKIEKKEAQKLMNTMFTNFKDGERWIKETKKHLRDTGEAVSPIGTIRHLYNQLHWNESVHARSRRQGHNSIIQGISSQMGFQAGRELMRMKWYMFEKKNQPLGLFPQNKVHDSSENRCMIVDLPLSAYLLEHAMTTGVHRYYREVFGFQLNCSLMSEIDIGPHLGDMYGWDYSADQMLEYVDKSMKWMVDNLKYKLRSDKALKLVEHNASIISKIRRKELKEIDYDGPAPEIMHINAKNSLDLGLKFASDNKIVRD